MLKWYAVNRRLSITYVKNIKNKVCEIIEKYCLYKNGKRENRIFTHEYNEDLHSDLEKFDLIFYKFPSQDNIDEYDLLRLSNDKESFNDLEHKSTLVTKEKFTSTTHLYRQYGK